MDCDFRSWRSLQRDWIHLSSHCAALHNSYSHRTYFCNRAYFCCAVCRSLLHELFTLKDLVGSIIVIAGILIAQLDDLLFKKSSLPRDFAKVKAAR